MGWFSRFSDITEYMTLEVLMHLKIHEGKGVGSAQWTSIKPHPKFSETQTQIAISALNYGRALFVQRETREQLFRHIEGFALSLLSTGEVDFYVWPLEAGGMRFHIWPWEICSPNNVIEPKIYKATMHGTRAGILTINLSMAIGLEKILVPSCALIALFVLANKLDLKEREKLGEVLLAMNKYYENPEAAGAMFSEIKAFKSAVPILS